LYEVDAHFSGVVSAAKDATAPNTDSKAVEENTPHDAADDSEPQRDTLLCSVSGKLKKGKRTLAQPVSVGDRVRVRPLESTAPMRADGACAKAPSRSFAAHRNFGALTLQQSESGYGR
jgi:hypothetical protein